MTTNSPDHYGNNWRVGDFIRYLKLNFHLGNAVKYISRAGKKSYDDLTLLESYIKDLKKAIDYLENEITHIESLLNPITFRSGDPVPNSVWVDEWEWEPDDATELDEGGVQ